MMKAVIGTSLFYLMSIEKNAREEKATFNVFNLEK